MSIFPVFLCFLLFSTFSPSLSAERCNPQDKKVLLQIKKALNNPYLLASWDPKTDCCDWYCLECDELNTHRVKSLTMFSDDRLTGQIPAEIGDLPYLETIIFKHLPNLNGTIQPSIAKLKNLKFLWLSWTNISGPVPDFLSQLKNLTYLNLSFNNLSGSIPSSLSSLPNLDFLRLDRNKFTGSIPESFGMFPGKTFDLYLSHNKLSGTIPAYLGNMDFNTIDLSRNMLEGDPSVLFGSNKTTWGIDLSRNMFQFNLSKVEFPKTLARLDLNHNKIMGSIPVRLTGLELQFMNVSYNRLCGQIPVGGRLQSFDYSTYFHNRCLCGAPLESCK